MASSDTRISNQERYFFHNNLSILLKAVEGKKTTIDFRNESSITGIVEQVDGYMNVVMKNSTFVDPRGSAFNYEKFFVHSRNIRYVHIPPQDLKQHRITFLITGSNVDFADFTASYALGQDWKSLFDVIICYAKKPGFFTDSPHRPFLSIVNYKEDREVPCDKLKRGGIYSQGNWKELKAFFAREIGKESPSCLYVGDNLIQDIYTPKRHADCDTVAVVEEQLSEGMTDHTLCHMDEKVLNSNTWGSYFRIISNDKLHPSIWSHIIDNYSKICVPSVELLVNNSLDTPLKSFGDEEDRKLCGYHPGKPKSVVL